MKNYTFLLMALLYSAITIGQSQGVSLLGQKNYTDNVNDVWGYADNAGNEYALVGLETGLSIVDVTNPAAPNEEIFISGAFSIWRDMKTWDHYAYTVHDVFNGTSDGILIVDMNTIENSNPSYSNFNPLISFNGNTELFQRAHNLYIDEKGFLYAFGSNVGAGGALIFDLKPDPLNPTFVGIFDQYYFHDGVARGDTLWGAAINNGAFSVVDVSNKSSTQVMATQTTPFNFCHNIWFSDDNQRVFTTDERTSAYIAEYDVSDLNNISELDRIRTSFGNNVIPHNAHFYNNFLVNSYYTAGLQIVDVSQPGIMVETAFYDSSPLSGDGFTGAWGAYPYLPSGNILVSDRGEGLLVLSSTYPRACFFNATVTDSVGGQNLLGASISFLNSDISGQTDVFGNFKDGQAQSGTFTVVVSKSGYYNDTLQVSLMPGSVVNKQVKMVPFGFSVQEYGSLAGMEVYPNPARDVVNISNLKPGIEKLGYSLISTSGQVLLQGELSTSSGKGALEINQQAGCYILQLQYDNEAPVSQRLIIR